jgi:cytochrome c biogenesis factor
MEPNFDMPHSAKECFLHRSLAISVVAFALSAYLLADTVLNSARPDFPYVRRAPFFILGPLMGVWLLATLAQRCKQLRERLFYSAGTVYFVALSVRTVLPLSPSAIRVCALLDLALGATGVALSGTIVLWHLRMRMNRRGGTHLPGKD